jgi:phosphotransferase system enzyme I (PtsI)
MSSYQGISVFPGIAIAKVVWARPHGQTLPARPFQGEDAELKALETAVQRTEKQIEKIKKNAFEKIGAAEAEIFEAHRMMLMDPEYLDGIRSMIKDEKSPGALAIQAVTDMFVQILSKASSDYLRERVLDLKDVSARLKRNFEGGDEEAHSEGLSILVADDLLPSDLMALAQPNLLGVVLRGGGLTSHTAILLKSMGIPSVFGVKGLPAWSENSQQDDEILILDAKAGKVILRPDPEVRELYGEKEKQEFEARKLLVVWRDKESRLACGTKMAIVANVASQKQVETAVENGADGVGLYRTEFLFMDRAKAPTEDEQTKIYSAAVQSLKGKSLTIRTLDIGGDKSISYLELPKEDNPFLGVRGLRLCLQHPDLFRTQLRALLRASTLGPIDVMFPMVTTDEELQQVFEILRPLQAEPAVQHAKIRWGMMLEIPVNLFEIPELSKYVDFFSVGTNDLTQYLTACDRMNPQLSGIGDPYSPGVLRAMAFLSREVNSAKRELSICGEMASEALLIPYLIGIGVRKLSQNPRLVGQTRRDLSRWTLVECEELAAKVLKLGSRVEIRETLREFVESKG